MYSIIDAKNDAYYYTALELGHRDIFKNLGAYIKVLTKRRNNMCAAWLYPKWYDDGSYDGDYAKYFAREARRLAAIIEWLRCERRVQRVAPNERLEFIHNVLSGNEGSWYYQELEEIWEGFAEKVVSQVMGVDLVWRRWELPEYYHWSDFIGLDLSAGWNEVLRQLTLRAAIRAKAV